MKDDLEAQAERLFPMPLTNCKWAKAKVEWKRKQWINSKKQKNARI